MKKILTLLGLLVVLCTTKAYAGIDKTRIFSTSENTQIEFAPYNLLAEADLVPGEEYGREDPEIYVAREFMLSEDYDEFPDSWSTFPWGCNQALNAIHGKSEEDAEYFDTATTLDEINPEFGGDWGNNIEEEIGSQWRTPSYKEFDYILNKRPNAAERRYNLYLYNRGFQGILLLPDNPNERLQGLIERSNVLNGNDLHIGADSAQYFTEVGAVFLQYESDYNKEYYWTATGYDVTKDKGEAPYETAMALCMRNNEGSGPEVGLVNIARNVVAHVRLVRSVYKVTSVPNFAERGETITEYTWGDEVRIYSQPKEGYEYYQSEGGLSVWSFGGKEGFDIYDVHSDTTILTYYRSVDKKKMIFIGDDFRTSDSLQLMPTDEVAFAVFHGEPEDTWMPKEKDKWFYATENDYGYYEIGVGDNYSLRAPSVINRTETRWIDTPNGEIDIDVVVPYRFVRWHIQSEYVINDEIGADLIDDTNLLPEAQATDTIITLQITENTASMFYVSAEYIVKEDVAVETIDDFISIIQSLSDISQDGKNTNAWLNFEGKVSYVPEGLAEDSVSNMTQEQLDELNLDEQSIPTLSSIAGNFIGEIVATDTEIDNVMLQMDGSLFNEFDSAAVLQNLIFDNAAIYLRISDDSKNWTRSNDGDTIYINILANEVSGLIDGFALAGHISVRDERSAEVRKGDADLVDYVISVIGEVKEGATVNGFYFDMFTSKKTLKAVRLREVQPIKMDNSGSGGSCKMASTYSDFGVKKAIYDFRYSEDELNKSSRKFSEEEFACGAVAYWLNYSGPGYTGQYTAKWAQGVKYPVLAKSADDALYGINYKCGIFADDVITKLTHFATKGNVVTMEYTQKPTKILVDGKDITTLEGSTFGDESASFIMTVGNKSVEFVYPTTYTVSYKTAEGDVLKTAEEVSTYVGDKVNASDAQLANIKKDGVVYKYVSGNEEITIVEDPKPTDNVLNLVFAADSATTTVNFLYGEKALKDAEVVMGKIGKALVATDAQLANIELDGVTYKYVKGNTEKTIAATTSDNVLNLEFAVLTNYTINFVLEDGTVLKEAFTADIVEGSTFTASEEQMAYLVYNNRVYAYVSGNEEKTATATAADNVISLVFEPKEVATTFTINFVADGKVLKEAEVVGVDIDATYTASAEQLGNINIDGLIYVYASGNEEKTALEDASQNAITLVFEAKLVEATINFTLSNGYPLKDAETVEVEIGKEFAATEAQLANIVVDGVTHTYVSGNVAKVAVDTPSSNVITLVFATVKATPVRSIAADKANDGTIYDLRGVKVTNPSRGLYIQNGRLILVK